MPAPTEATKALEEARAAAERLHHAYAATGANAENDQARDLFARLAAWELHHFEQVERAQAAMAKSGDWIDYEPTDYAKTKPGTPGRKTSRPPAVPSKGSEALAFVLEGERGNYRLFLGLAAKAKAQRERDFWTALAADAELHARTIREQIDALRTGGAWSWDGTKADRAPKPALAATKHAVAMISPISTTDLPVAKPDRKKETKGEKDTELLPPGWESMEPEKSQKFREVGWSPPEIADPKTPIPGTVMSPRTPAPAASSNWIPAGPEAPANPWIAADKQHLIPQPKPERDFASKNPTTIRHVGHEADRKIPTGGSPGREFVPTDTAIMDRPMAHTGGRWIYEASVKTAAQLCAPDAPPPDAEVLAMISGPGRKVFLDILNRRGAQGWELLQLAFHQDSVVFFWKRRE